MPSSRERSGIVGVWNRALAGVPPLHHHTVERLMQALDSTSRADSAWRAYVEERYGV